MNGEAAGREFVDRLAISVTLTTASGTAHKVSPGDVTRLELDLWPWGFEAELEFVRADTQGRGGQEQDALLADFLLPDLLTVEIEVKASLSDRVAQPTFTGLTIKGLVAARRVAEVSADSLRGSQILWRRYGLRLLDPAQLLLRQHHPVELYTDKSLKDVIAAQLPDGVSITCDWSAQLDSARPLVFLGLPASDGASFYDLLVWFTDQHAGVFTRDYATHGYKLAAEKDTSSEPLTALSLDVDSLRIDYPEVIRHSVNVQNSWTEGAKVTAVAQDQAVAPIRHDILLATPISDETSARVTRETARLKARGPELWVEWSRFPMVPLPPGARMKFDDITRFSQAGMALVDGTFRVVRLSLSAQAEGEEVDAEHLADSAPYRLRLGTRLEQDAEPTVVLPPYSPPVEPHYAEGLVVSEVGAQDELTWQAYSDSKTSVDGYKVKVPLWANQVVTAPFNPNLLPGQFYFPAYKGQRVLLGFDLFAVWIKRYLDWRPDARLPQDSQGEHLLVGKKIDNGTSIRHVYVDAKPVFTIARTNAKDKQTIEVKEGVLRIEVKEDA